ncbi:MAG: 23S rRNA (guanosine(2251)-2'-O)-methyltransferase RlmB [Candidatus Dormibacteria bacterium]
MDVLYGRNPVLEALRAGRPARKLVVAEGLRDEARLREILALAGARGLSVEETGRRRLDDITHTEHHQGVAGYFHAREPLEFAALLEAAPAPALLLVLDGIQDPQNLGALSRTAEAVGVGGVLTTRRGSTEVTPAAAKASAGATEHLRYAQVPNLAGAMLKLKERGVWCVGLAGEGEHRYDTLDYTQPTAIVVGAEGDGLRPLTRRHCDALVHIPMLGRVSSLNAGAAGAVLLYEVARQRGFTVPARVTQAPAAR